MEGFYAPGHSAVLDEERSQDRGWLTELENRAIREVVERQVECGLDVVSDGEFRRWMFLNSFYDAVEGFRTDNVVTFRNDAGSTGGAGRSRDRRSAASGRQPGGARGGVHGSITRHPFKVTFPAASIFGHPFTFKRGLTDRGYVDLAEFVAHAIEIERALVADAVAAGAGYIQFDFPLYPYLVDPAWVGRFRERGHDPAALLEAALAADTAVLDGIPEHVTTALHICRGNYRSSWMCEGSLEPVAEAVFGGLPYDTFLVEWDDMGRDGGFEPIRFLRPGSVMVMGLISSKVRDLESEDDLMRQMDEAAAIVGGIDRLAISPQCGFASVMVGNDTDTDAQWRKLELVGRIADRLWRR